MLCDECQKNLATVHLTKVINNLMSKAHLCEECAKNIKDVGQFNFMDIFESLPEMLTGMFSMLEPTSENSLELKSIHCPTCGSSFNDLKDTGKLGCGNCYPAFSERLEPILKKIHSNDEHHGKMPLSISNETKKKIELRNLKNELSNLIEHEKFEQAATVRDEIKKIETERNRQ